MLLCVELGARGGIMADKQGGSDGVSILLVDDEEDILASLKEFLEVSIESTRVDTATSGAAALEMMQKHSYNLVISDYKMPKMDGLEFLTLASERAPQTPRVLLTAFPKMELAIRAINEVSVDRFLTKPIRPEELLEVVQAILRKHRNMQSAGKKHAFFS
jgi:YesN/AraC family two-component response regulator